MLGRYELGEELGEGGMATVYLARDRELRREVAIKVLFPHLGRNREAAARFQREARAVAALDHRHILRVHDVGGGPGEGGEAELDPPFIVLELVRGKSLAERLQLGGPPIAEVVACMGVAIAEALDHAHRAGIIHRDVKPANLLVAEGGRLVLGDFGVARVTDEDSIVTRTGALLGTPAFMSPEQATAGELDARSDLYSLGATLYQLATGSLPVAGNAARAVAAILAGDVIAAERRNPRIGSELGRVIERLMRVERAERHASAAEVAAALRAIARDGGLPDPDQALADYFADPAEFEARLQPAVVDRTLARARAALGQGEVPRALALCERVLALAPGHAEATALVARIAGRRRGLALALGLALVAAFAWWWPHRPGHAVAAPDAGVALAATTPDLAPRAAATADAATPVEATPRDAGPARAVAVAGSRSGRARVIAHGAPIDAGVPVAAAPDAGSAVVVAPARLTLVMHPWCNVTIDGVDLGRADAGRGLEVAPGTHHVVCSQGKGLGTWQDDVTVAAGERRTVRGEVLREVEVTVDLATGDAVRLTPGGRVARGTHRSLRPGRYRVELLAGDQTLAVKYLTLARQPCVLRDRPELGCYAE